MGLRKLDKYRFETGMQCKGYQITFGEGGASFWKALTVDRFGFLKQQKKEFSNPSSPSATKLSALLIEPVWQQQGGLLTACTTIICS